jgi:hypothetical protein
MLNSEELIGRAEYLMKQTRCRINQCSYNQVQLHICCIITSLAVAVTSCVFFTMTHAMLGFLVPPVIISMILMV